MKVLSKEKIGQYLAEAEQRGLLPIYYLELITDLRRVELLTILWTDLDVKKMTIHAEHLHPRNASNEAERSEYHRKCN